ncbi:V-type proton ATPase subunit c'' [Arachis hypogaea]|nr:V-type proton ATPase subunit c'' [Arachis hypogaea]
MVTVLEGGLKVSMVTVFYSDQKGSMVTVFQKGGLKSPSLPPPSEARRRRRRPKLSAHRLHLRWLLRSSKVSGVRSWGTALIKISPYTFSAVGIGVSIGVSVLSAAWYAVSLFRFRFC